MKLWNHYYTPATTEEAVALLMQYAGEARVIAGGTDLLIDLRAEGGSPYEALVDITSIPDLRDIEEVDGYVVIGAGVTHTQIVKSSLLAQQATCLVESCGVVGGPQVRNVATLGGNVAHALPAGDGTTSLVALNAEAEIIKDGVRQWVPILDMYVGPGQSLLTTGKDILLKLRFPLSESTTEATAFSRIMRPQGVALPVLGCAVWIKLEDDHFVDARVCIAPVAPTPKRITEVENTLKGKPATEATIQAAIETAKATLNPRTSKYRATAEYRHEMSEVLLRRTLTRAIKRVQTGEVSPEGVGA